MGDFCLLWGVLQRLSGLWAAPVEVIPLTDGAGDAARLAAECGSVRVRDFRTVEYQRLMGPRMHAPAPALLECLAAARLIILHDVQHAAELQLLRARTAGPVVFLDGSVPVRQQNGRHITQHWAETLARAGVELGTTGPMAGRLDLGPTGTQPDRVVLCPGAGNPRKCWPAEAWRQLADELVADGRRIRWWIGWGEGPRLQALVGPGEERVRAGTLAERLRHEVLPAGCVYANDSGMAHGAATCGARVRVVWTAAFGADAPAHWWRPAQDQVEVIQPPAVVPSVAAVRG